MSLHAAAVAAKAAAVLVFVAGLAALWVHVDRALSGIQSGGMGS